MEYSPRTRYSTRRIEEPDALPLWIADSYSIQMKGVRGAKQPYSQAPIYIYPRSRAALLAAKIRASISKKRLEGRATRFSPFLFFPRIQLNESSPDFYPPDPLDKSRATNLVPRGEIPFNAISVRSRRYFSIYLHVAEILSSSRGRGSSLILRHFSSPSPDETRFSS